MKHKLLIISLLFSINANAQISVFSDFENGNIDFISYDSILNKITFKPALKNEFNTTRCWFYFGITGYDTTKNLTIANYYSARVVAPEYPVFSYDKKHWERLKSHQREYGSKKVIHKFSGDTVYFAAGYPYTYSEAINFVDEISQNKYIDTMTLTYSEGGLRVPMFIIQDKNENPTNLIWITGRQHAFETTMSFVLEEMIYFLISDNKKAKKLRKNTIIYVVPMMDVDNVKLGASGRMQKPIDFNRDWSESPHWKAVREVQKMIKKTSQIYNYSLFFDVHSTFPGATKPIFGLFNEYSKNSKEYSNLRTFLELFYKNANYELDEISGDMNQNYSDAYSAGIIDSTINVTEFSTTIECDWTINHNNKPLTINELRNVGKLFGVTICDYMKKK